MHTDPAISMFVLVIFATLMLSIIMRLLKQPHVLSYLIVGLVLGPSVLGVITDHDALTRLGSFGVVMLLFFIGMEVSPKRLAENWLISVVGTLLQIFISLAAVAIIGFYLEWTIARIVLLGFVISLSSTAVVLKLLSDWKELGTRVGQDVLGILLIQDLIFVPMLIILGFLGGHKPDSQVLMLQAIGGVIIVSLTIWLLVKNEIRLPWLKYLGSDHEMQVFTSLGICFGMALLTGVAHLSAALGAFIGGMIVSSAKETHWVHQSLSSIRTVSIAIFFVSVGMLIDVRFIADNVWQILLLIMIAYLTNFLINALILKCLGENWNVSLYGGALLSQIGEFSFVIAALGLQMKIINQISYQMTISVIALTLLFSPLWISFVKNITKIAETRLRKV